MFGKIKKFFVEVLAELKKVAWSTKKELIDATWIVLVSSFMLGFFIWIADTILVQFLGLIIR